MKIHISGLVTNKYFHFLGKRRWNIGVKRPCLIAVVIEVALAVVGVHCLKCFRRRWRSYRSPQSSIVPRDKCFSLPLWGRVRFRERDKGQISSGNATIQRGSESSNGRRATTNKSENPPTRRIFRDESALC